MKKQQDQDHEPDPNEYAEDLEKKRAAFKVPPNIVEFTREQPTLAIVAALLTLGVYANHTEITPTLKGVVVDFEHICADLWRKQR